MKQYKELMNPIAPSDALLAETRRRMRERTKPERHVPLPRLLSVAACAVLVIAAAALLPRLLGTQPPVESTAPSGVAAATSDSATAASDAPSASAVPGTSTAPITTAAPTTSTAPTPKPKPSEGSQYQQTVRLANGVLYFPQADLRGGARLYYDPKEHYSESWTQAQITDYLGTDFHPAAVPADLREEPGNEKQKVTFKNDGSIAHAVFSAYYSEKIRDEEASEHWRTLVVEAAKGAVPTQCGIIVPDSEARSHINGVALTVGCRRMDYGPYSEKDSTPAGYYDVYVATFVYQGVGYYVQSDNLTQAEFVAVLQSIIK